MHEKLSEIEQFYNDDEFHEVKSKIERIVRRGGLFDCGLDPAEKCRFIEVYRTPDGEIWRLAVPDHGFRGYLKKD